MALTPEDVQQKEFAQQFRGYNEIEVDAFLDEVERELSRLTAENDDLRERLASAAAAQAAAPPPTAEGEELLRRTLVLAQRTADETVASARAEADRLMGDARAQADRLLADSRAQASHALGDLDTRRAQLEEQIERLRAFDREVRTRLKAYFEAQLRDLEARGSVVPDRPAGTPETVVAPRAAATSTFAPVEPTAASTVNRGTTVAADADVPRVAP